MVSVGEVVISRMGHDKGEFFIVIDTDGEYVTICDGKRRKAAKKKKKKIKHILPTGLCVDGINNIPQYAVDANIRREIRRLKNCFKGG